MNSTYIDSELGDLAAGIAWPSGLRQHALSLCQSLGENGYWAIALSLTVAAFIIGWRLLRGPGSCAAGERTLSLVVAVLSAALLLAFRWPTFIHQDLNVDEDFLIAGALTFRHTWDYFGALDGTTSGPLNFAPLITFLLLGFRIDLAMARIISLIFVWAALLSIYFAAKTAGSIRVAFFATLFLSLLFGSFSHPGWVHYSSAHVSVCLISIAFSLLVSFISKRKVDFGRSLVFGVVLSLMPFAKLQSLPFVLIFEGWFLLLVFSQVKDPTDAVSRKLWLSGLTLLIIIAPILLILSLRSVSTAVNNFWISYFEFSVHYSQAVSSSLGERLSVFKRMLGSDFEITYVFSLFVLLFLLFFLLTLANHLRNREAALIGALCLSTLFASFVAVIVPGRDFTHYLQFLLVPGYAAIVTLAAQGRYLIRSEIHAPAAACCLSVIALLPRFSVGHPSFAQLQGVAKVHETFVSKVIQPLKFPQDQLVVWGWCVKLHGQTQTSPGTMDVITERHIRPSPLQHYYRERYLKDIIQRKPAFFVDSTGSNSCALDFIDRKKFGHEIFPALREEIDSNYQFLCDQEQLRLYVSYERLLSYISAPYLYPLIVYLDLTATGNLQYDRFEFLVHQLIERERIRRERYAVKTPDVPETLQAIANQVLNDMVAGGLVPADTAESLKERATRIVRSLQQQSPEIAPQTEVLDAIRRYRRIFKKSDI